MSRLTKVLASTAAVVALVLLVLWIEPRVSRALAPVPKAAWVAVEPEGSGVAEIGAVEIEAGTRFRLHAVLEADDRNGDPVYYTGASRLRVDGADVDAERIRPWNRSREVKILWFTVEPFSPYVELAEGQGLERLRFEEFLHPEWSTLWTVDGVMDRRFDDQIANGTGHLPFGTQRYQVWIEILDPESPLVAKQRFKAPGAQAVLERSTRVAAVTALLPEAPVASAVFGLAQVEPPPDADEALLADLERAFESRQLFTRVTLLRAILERGGSGTGAPRSTRLELAAAPRWGHDVRAGDLIQVGARWVVLYRDEGRAGILDDGDLCLDFDEGAAIRPLGEVFQGDGEVDRIPLGP